MRQYEQLDRMLMAQDGMLQTAQVVSAVISKPVFYHYVRDRNWNGWRMAFIFPGILG